MKQQFRIFAAIIFSLFLTLSPIKSTSAFSLGDLVPSIDSVIEIGSALTLNPIGISVGFLWDGDIFGNELGLNWDGIQQVFGNNKNPSPSESFEKCLKRKPTATELDQVTKIAKEKGWNGQQIAVALCKSEEAKNKDEDGAEDQSPSETFLWKPKSDSDGKLVVLLPSSMRGQVVSVAVQKDGKTLDTGRFSGDTHNGMRPHFRFPKAGGDYGSNLQLVTMGATGACSFSIPNGAKRTEGAKKECGASVMSGSGVSDFDVGAYLNSITGGTLTGGAGNTCEPYFTPEPGQIPDKIEGVSLISGKQSLVAYQPGYRASAWMMFHKGDKIKLKGTGYLMIAWESEAHHPNAPESSFFTPPGMTGDITYVGDLPDDGKGNAHLPIGAPGMHAWPDGSDSRLRLFCIDGEATITDRENTGGTQWYNMMIDVVPPVCEPVKKIQTNFVPYNQNIVDRCAAKLKTATTTASTSSTQNAINTYLQNLLGATTAASTTSTTNSLSTSKDLAISCEISDTSIEVGEETEISVDISGGTSPYKVRWSGDTSKVRKIGKTKESQDIEFKKSGKYVLEVKVTDDKNKSVEEICSTINVYEKDAVREEEAVNSTDYTTQTTSTTQTFTFYRDLTVGSEGADVIALQDYLIARGFLTMPSGVAKGYFGALTQSAVARWQAAVGLTPAAGYFGQKSRTYISTGIIPVSTTQTYVAPAKTTPAKTTVSAASCVNVTKTLTYEQSSPDVSKVQDFLEMKGYLTMPEGASKGTYGKLTATAIANYMATKGISTSGRVADESVLSQIRKDTGCAY